MEVSPARTYAVPADSGADAIVRALAEAGARLMFGVPGGGPNLDVVGAAATSLADLDPIYKRLLDEPVTAIVAVTGSDAQPNLTPVWFDYEGDTVLLNLATHRKKVDWLRKVPNATFLLMNPENTYHWLSLKTVVKREVSEDNPVEGRRVTDQLDRIWVKYTGNEPPCPGTLSWSRWRTARAPKPTCWCAPTA